MPLPQQGAPPHSAAGASHGAAAAATPVSAAGTMDGAVNGGGPAATAAVTAATPTAKRVQLDGAEEVSRILQLATDEWHVVGGADREATYV